MKNLIQTMQKALDAVVKADRISGYPNNKAVISELKTLLRKGSSSAIVHKSDKELLLAAKAAGIQVDDSTCELWELQGGSAWNPLTSNDDAFRLAMHLGFSVEPGKCWVTDRGPMFGEDALPCEVTATRRAIVRAAAEIGRNLK